MLVKSVLRARVWTDADLVQCGTPARSVAVAARHLVPNSEYMMHLTLIGCACVRRGRSLY